MPIANYAASALVNLLTIVGVPFIVYVIYQKWRKKRALREVVRRAGLQCGKTRYLVYSIAFAVATVGAIIIWAPPIEPLVREGSPQRAFLDLGFGGSAVAMALLYGVVKTGFPEELLFRGLIGGSLSRRLSFFWANLLQALIFLAPHLLVIRVMPEMWRMLVFIFAGALFLGWVRIRSGSILGPWMVHASINVATCLSVAIRSAA